MSNETLTQKKTKKGIKTLIIIASILLVLISAVLIYYFGATHPDFYLVATKDFQIPGLNTKFVPQGLDYDQTNEVFLVSGYMSNGETSRIYIVDSSENFKYFTLKVDGENYLGHAGGIAVSGDYAFVVGDGFLYRFNFKQALLLENGQSIEVIDYFETGNGADFVLTYNNKLIVGEFYLKGKYDTNTEHHIKLSETETNYAMSYIYTINHSNTCGLQSLEPEAGISMGNKIQGMSFTKDGNIVLSSSYSIPNSKIYIYENVLNETHFTTTSINGKEIKVYVLSSENLVKTIDSPAMSEELVLKDNKVYVLFESNCAKYRLVNRTRLSNVYALDI